MYWAAISRFARRLEPWRSARCSLGWIVVAALAAELGSWFWLGLKGALAVLEAAFSRHIWLSWHWRVRLSPMCSCSAEPNYV